MSSAPGLSHWLARMAGPCDPEIFRKALEVWQTGAQFPLRKRPVAGSGFVLADIDVNRSAMATIGFLRARGVAQPQAYLVRLMHFYEVLEAAQAGGALARFVKPSDADDCVMISEALLDAVAEAPVPVPLDPRAPQNGPTLDIAEIARRAQVAFEAEELPGEGGL